MEKRGSYTAASTIPVKLIRLQQQCITDKRIAPVHIQLCPTNVCNLNCAFCSCEKREKNLALSLEQVVTALDDFASLGTKAMTITGGGEPCCYPHLPAVISGASRRGIQCGLVTNGFLLDRLPTGSMQSLTWCRVSASDDRDVDKLLHCVAEAYRKAPEIDWAFSYVVTERFGNGDTLAPLIQFANEHTFTHVRVVSDLMDVENCPDMESVRDTLEANEVDTSRVIFQGRKAYEQGDRRCRISLLKPVIAPDGWVYPCCGVQYAIPAYAGMFPEPMRMCRIEEAKDYWKHQHVFNGSHCVKCYYGDYNRTLSAHFVELDHEVFV